MKRFLLLIAVLFFLILWVGCGQTFRPIIIPNPPQFPNPAASHSVISINDNGVVVDGSAMDIDVSGDSIVGIVTMGLRPVHAVMATSNLMLVANQSVPGAGSDSVTKVTFFGTVISSTSTVTLPAGSAPNFVASAPGDTKAYISLPGESAVGILTESDNNVTPITVGTNPVAIAVTPDTTKLYVANFGSKSISAFNTVDRSTRTICDSSNTCPPAMSAPPIWLSARTDSQRVYVLESNGTLGYITISTTAGPDIFRETGISVPTAAIMWYDVILNRLYIPGQTGGGPGVAIVDVSQSMPNLLASVAIPAVTAGSRQQSDPCSRTTQPGGNSLIVTNATSLPDGSRAYVGSYYIDSADNVCPQVTVINTKTNSISTATAVPGFPDATNPTLDSGMYYVPVCANTRDLVGATGNGFRLSMAAGGDSSRVYLASCDGGNVNIIYTDNDTYAENAPAPASARPPLQGTSQNPPQNPLFLIAGP